MVQPLPSPRTPTSPTPHRRRRAASLLLGLSAVAGLAAAGGCDHPRPPARVNPVAVLPPGGSFAKGWLFDTKLSGDDHVVRLETRAQTLYAYTADKRVLTLDRRAGTQRFSMSVYSPASTLLSVVETPNYLVFPNATQIEVYDRKTGAFVRHVPVDSPLQSNAAAESDPKMADGAGDVIYFGAAGRGGVGLVKRYILSRPDAPQDWEYITRDEGRVDSAPAVWNGFVFSASSLGEIDAVNTARTQVWDTEMGRFYAAGAVVGDLVVDPVGLYFASRDTKVYCLNKTSGRLMWQYFAGRALSDAPVATSDTLYQFVAGMGIVAIDKLAGDYNRKPKWVNDRATQFLAQDDRNAYLAVPRPSTGDADAPAGMGIIAVDKRTGKVVFESDRSDYASFATNPYDPTIYAAMEDGKLMEVHAVLRPGQIGELVLDLPVRRELAKATVVAAR